LQGAHLHLLYPFFIILSIFYPLNAKKHNLKGEKPPFCISAKQFSAKRISGAHKKCLKIFDKLKFFVILFIKLLKSRY